MPSEIFEESIELEIGLLEAVTPTADSYPYPSLTPSGASEKRKFRAAILENPLLRATFVPALGGRLLSLFDKRTQVELLSSGPLIPVADGRRGAHLSRGIQLHLDGGERLTSLGEAQFAKEEPDDERPPGLWLAEAVTGTGLSWHAHVSLPEDRAELRLEARVFNRTFDEIPYNGGLLVEGSAAGRAVESAAGSAHSKPDSKVFVIADGGNGIALMPERGAWSVEHDSDSLVLSRFDQPRMLAPRQLDTWVVSIRPFSGLHGVSAVSEAAALCVGEDLVQIQAATVLRNHKLVLLTRTGQTLEAPVEVFPERVLEMALPEPVRGVVLLDPSKREVLRWEGSEGISRKGRNPPPTPSRSGRENAKVAKGGWDKSNRTYKTDEKADIEEATFEVATRHFAYAMLGERALGENDPVEAEDLLEQALLYNAEDHLAWWMKAIAIRLQATEADTSPELLNAHYLAPLEPALRAESFLSQPGTLEREPGVLLKPMAEFPEHFIEVAALLAEAGLFEQASRWIDECLRHVDLPMLRYLLAYAYLSATGLDLEAAEQVAAAAKQPIGPPYPWRRVEIAALEVLSKRFPQDQRLQELREIASS
ncbi:MAG: hypothetical protein ACHQ50_00335 [Fimbriimonadales bacterium]